LTPSSGSTPTATATPRRPGPNGGVRATLEVPSDRAGHARLLRLADEQAPGRRVWALGLTAQRVLVARQEANQLEGAAPVQASSGQVVRHRLNRGGDRQLNRALHTIMMLR
jgi:Transposase IS116/IS110/IS902 family